MDVIYSHAYLAIIAAAGDDAHAGIPPFGSPRFTSNRSLLECRTSNLVASLSPQIASEAIATSKWSSRGWTPQEHALSRRVLFSRSRTCSSDAPSGYSVKTSAMAGRGPRIYTPISRRGTSPSTHLQQDARSPSALHKVVRCNACRLRSSRLALQKRHLGGVHRHLAAHGMEHWASRLGPPFQSVWRCAAMDHARATPKQEAGRFSKLVLDRMDPCRSCAGRPKAPLRHVRRIRQPHDRYFSRQLLRR
jgi:hypothetical protein